MKTFVDAGMAGVMTSEHGTMPVPMFGQPGMIAVLGISVARSAGAPPMFTTVCFGTGFATPPWCGHWITALMLQIGGTVFLCGEPARSIAPPSRLGNRRIYSEALRPRSPHDLPPWARGFAGADAGGRRRRERRS